jgi:glycosyltransferase involved in cell wall biosynthesis
MTDISFIVSAFDRPEMLKCCLASLRVQTHRDIEIIVTDNSQDPDVRDMHYDTAYHFGAKYLATKASNPYHSAEMGAKIASGEYLCFPSDDSYYVPPFAAEMLKYGRFYDLDLVYCNLVYDGRWEGEPYFVMDVEPRLNVIDKTNFIVRKSVFPGFPDQPDAPVAFAADGMMIERLMKAGVSHRKHKGVMVVHN